MDALLTALLGCLLGEMGDKSQWLVLALASRYQRDGVVLAGVAIAAACNAALSAAAGALLAPMLAGNARLLFLALAILFLGVGMVFRVKRPDMLDGWKLGAFLTTAFGLFILGFGDGPQFLILGIATRTGDPVMAAIGGAVGVTLAAVPVIALREQFYHHGALRAVRLGGGVMLLVVGGLIAASALAIL
ncbi:TMEM165/GDT1 family protein [Sphingobium aromaticiconvertens]|uniref:TMEM165/GDT1 family protein n=1 Tax=Sphingobium aromaticiconvertens TaxID=365341 RepID=UPI003018B4C4